MKNDGQSEFDFGEDPDDFDLNEGRRRKKEGMDRVWENNEEWMDHALAVMRELPRGWCGLAEDWRVFVSRRIGEPKHSNAWGKLAELAIERGLVRKNGIWRKMRLPTSNARKTPEYVKL